MLSRNAFIYVLDGFIKNSKNKIQGLSPLKKIFVFPLWAVKEIVLWCLASLLGIFVGVIFVLYHLYFKRNEARQD